MAGLSHARRTQSAVHPDAAVRLRDVLEQLVARHRRGGGLGGLREVGVDGEGARAKSRVDLDRVVLREPGEGQFLGGLHEAVPSQGSEPLPAKVRRKLLEVDLRREERLEDRDRWDGGLHRGRGQQVPRPLTDAVSEVRLLYEIVPLQPAESAAELLRVEMETPLEALEAHGGGGLVPQELENLAVTVP